MTSFNHTTTWSVGYNKTETGSNTTSLWERLSAASTPTIIALLIMVITVIGNSTLILTIVSKSSRRMKRVNVFLVNLAIGDLFVAFIVMTSEMTFFAFGEWVMGSAACKLTLYLQIQLLAASTFLLTAMSFDRYQVIVKPMESLTKRPKIWKKVVFAWCMAFIFATPQLGVFVQREVKSKKQCISQGYTAEWQRKLYFSFLTCYILVVPGIVMMFCYSKIMKVIWERSCEYKSSASSDDTSPRMSLNRRQVGAARRKAVIMSLTVILGFLSCVAPYYLVSLIRIYSDYRIKLTTLNEASKLIIMLHSALNPFLYGFFMLKLKHLYCLIPKMCLQHCSLFRRKNPDVVAEKGALKSIGQNGTTQDADPRHKIYKNAKMDVKLKRIPPSTDDRQTRSSSEVLSKGDSTSQTYNTVDVHSATDERASPQTRSPAKIILTQTETGNVIGKQETPRDVVDQYVSSV